MKQTLTFPKKFLFGTATSAYQIEGAWNSDGKGESVWDEFSRRKGKIKNGDDGTIACDHYHKYSEDVKLMNTIGIESYRFSISWPRVIPAGKGKLNQKGLDFYDRLVDSLCKKNIKPFVTLYHWDLPLALEEIGGWYNRDLADYFADYSEAIVKKLGDRVDTWVTLNEPWIVLVAGYVLGVFPPGKIRPFSAMKVAHNLLLAHGKSTQRIKSVSKKSKVGLVNALSPVYSQENLHEKEESLFEHLTHVGRNVSIKADAIMNRLWLDPIYFGKYPKEIESIVWKQNKGNILPDDMKIISTPTDFLGINHYTRTIAKWIPFPVFSFIPGKPKKKGTIFTSMGWEVYPRAFYALLKRIAKDYDNPPIYITENGAAFYEKLENSNGKKILDDQNRISFLKNYITEMHRAMQDGVDVRGYFQWSLLDNFEWAFGYEKTFGIVHVDRTSPDLTRTLKESAKWYGKLCKTHKLESFE